MSSKQKKLLSDPSSITSGEEPEFHYHDFKFEKKLGTGGFGQVWRALHTKTSVHYAIKKISKEKIMNMLSQLQREISIMYTTHHPNIIKLHSHFEDNDYIYLVLELAEENLFQKLYREKSFIEKKSAEYFNEILSAVEYLHSQVPSIIHRDIKPENVLISKDGNLKLTDFGWSNYFFLGSPGKRFTFCGTPEYIPPEIIMEKGHDTSADIWCLGILLYEMLVGSSPFKSLSRKVMMENILTAKPKFPHNISPHAKDLIVKMLKKNPNKRPVASEIREHLWMISHFSLALQPKIQMIEPDSVDKEVMENKVTFNSNLKIKLGKTESEDYFIKNSRISQNEKLCEARIEFIKNELRAACGSVDETKTLIDAKSKEIKEMNRVAKKIKEQINLKKQEIMLVGESGKEISLKLLNVNVNTEKISSLFDKDRMYEKVQEKSAELIEKNAEYKKMMSDFSSAKEEYWKCNKDYFGKENKLEYLKQLLLDTKAKKISDYQANKTRIIDLQSQKKLLKDQIKNYKKYNKGLNDTEQDVKDFVFKLSYLKNIIEDLEEKVFATQKKIVAKEQDINNLTLEFENKKANIMSKIKPKNTNILEFSNIITSLKKKYSSAPNNKRKTINTKNGKCGVDLKRVLISFKSY